jgi:phosphoribosylanthranilate isomerase
MKRTRIKICGLTREQDVQAAVEAGADAVGFNCFARSARYVDSDVLERLASPLPAFVTPVLLFVNTDESGIRRALDVVPNALLQFHGDETPEQCAAAGRPYVRAVRMAEEVDLLDCERIFHAASALLADAPVEGYGGGGKTFDWAMLPSEERRRKPLILAGGLNAGNVGRAMAAVQPYAVDVSSGVETARGIKSAEKIREFIAAVRAADAQPSLA